MALSCLHVARDLRPMHVGQKLLITVVMLASQLISTLVSTDRLIG